MKKIYSRVDPQKILLVVNRYSDIKNKRTDLSNSNQFLQVATKELAKGTTFKPHKHNRFDRLTTITQEAWVFLNGSVEASFWDIDNSLIHKTILSAGDCVVVFDGGHSFTVLEDNTILYEFKTGPYYGIDIDKTFIKE